MANTRELEFQRNVAEVLSNPPYCHKVYFHESPNQFSIHGAKGYIDLYVETNPAWPYHDKFPVLGIETKVATSLGWLVDAISQVGKYKDDLARATYTIRGKKVPPPTIFLVVTPESWEEGFLYKWMPPELQPLRGSSEETVKSAQWGCWFGLTFLYERLLMKNGAALIRRGCFYTNMKGNHGAVTKYSLATFPVEVMEVA